MEEKNDNLVHIVKCINFYYPLKISYKMNEVIQHLFYIQVDYVAIDFF